MRNVSLRICRLGLAAVAALTALALTPGTASACSRCHQNPCTLVAAPAPAPAYQRVTEMVPYTVMKTRTRIDFQPVTQTVMERVPETTWTERQRVVCKPVYDTTYVQRQRVVCKPVYDTRMVTQTYTVCRPVTTTRQITAYCMQPTTRYVSVPARGHCSLCGKAKPACGCITVAQTCYTQVPVVRDVVETSYVSDVQTRQVPVTHVRMVSDVVTDNIPVTKCRIVQEVVTDRIPHTTFHCEPRQVTRHVPVKVCETVPVTHYRKVSHMVPCGPPAYAAAYSAPQAMATGQGAPSGQAGPSGQN